MPKPLIWLASASPRRSELLRQIGVEHGLRPAAVDESLRADEAPADYVLRLARRKAQAVWMALAPAERRPVLAADTTVALDGEIFGKPADLEAALAMFARLSGRTHEVYTAVALAAGDDTAVRLSVSSVSFRVVPPDEVRWYWSTGEPADKAGGYAVQGRGAIFIRHLSGSYSGVMGLPLYETAELLRGATGLTAAGNTP